MWVSGFVCMCLCVWECLSVCVDVWWICVENGYISKHSIHKVLDHPKSNFDHEYLMNEKRFWHAVFFCWSVLLSSTFWAKMSQNGWVVFELGRKNLFFWYKIAYKKNWGFFFEKTARSLFCLYHCLTSCKELCVSVPVMGVSHCAK